MVQGSRVEHPTQPKEALDRELRRKITKAKWAFGYAQSQSSLLSHCHKLVHCKFLHWAYITIVTQHQIDTAKPHSFLRYGAQKGRLPPSSLEMPLRSLLLAGNLSTPADMTSVQMNPDPELAPLRYV